MKNMNPRRLLKIALVLLAAILQLAFFPLAIVNGSQWGRLWVLFEMMGVGAALFIASRNADGDRKLALSLFFVIFPFWAAALTAMKHLPHAGRKKAKERLMFQEKNRELLGENSLLGEISDPDGWVQGEIIRKTSGFPAYKNTKVKYLFQEQDFIAGLKEELQKAKNYIWIHCIWLKENPFGDSIEEILRTKAAEGLDVRVLYSAGTGKVKALEEAIGESSVKTQHCVCPLPVNAVVIDGGTGFVAAEKGIKNPGVMLKGDGVWSLTVLFLNRVVPKQAFGTTKTGDENSFEIPKTGFQNLSDIWETPHKTKEDFKPYKPAISYAIVPGFTAPYLSHWETACLGYRRMFSSARKYILLVTPSLAMDGDILSALILAAKSNVDVAIAFSGNSRASLCKSRAFYSQLLLGGVKLYQYTPGFSECSLAVCDDKTALTYFSSLHEKRREGLGLWIFNTPAVMEIKQDILATMSRSQEMLPEKWRPIAFITGLWHGFIKVIARLSP